MKYQNIPFTGPYFYPCFGLSIGNLDELNIIDGHNNLDLTC
jgi:hypothetical protein